MAKYNFFDLFVGFVATVINTNSSVKVPIPATTTTTTMTSHDS